MSHDHALSCPTGGYPSARHNEIRDILADTLQSIAHDVEIEPVLLPFEGENLPGRTANRSTAARLDIHARSFWTRQQDAFFDVRVTNPQGTPALCVRSTTPPSQPRTTEEAPVWPTGHDNRSRVFYTAGVRHKRNGRQGVRTIPENLGWTRGGEEWRSPLFSGDEPSSYETDDVHPPMEYYVFSWLPFIVHPEKVESVRNSVPSSLPKINLYIFLSEML